MKALNKSGLFLYKKVFNILTGIRKTLKNIHSIFVIEIIGSWKTLLVLILIGS